MSKKSEKVNLIAEREPLPEVVCIFVEELVMMGLVSILHPQEFDKVYRTSYPGDPNFTGISFWEDSRNLLSVVAMSRTFRERCLEYQRNGTISYINERDAWERFRADVGMPDMHLFSEVDAEEYYPPDHDGEKGSVKPYINSFRQYYEEFWKLFNDYRKDGSSGPEQENKDADGNHT